MGNIQIRLVDQLGDGVEGAQLLDALTQAPHQLLTLGGQALALGDVAHHLHQAVAPLHEGRHRAFHRIVPSPAFDLDREAGVAAGNAGADRTLGRLHRRGMEQGVCIQSDQPVDRQAGIAGRRQVGLAYAAIVTEQHHRIGHGFVGAGGAREHAKRLA